MARVVYLETPNHSCEEAARLRGYMAKLQISPLELANIWGAPLEVVEDVLAGRARLKPRDEQVLDEVGQEGVLEALAPVVDPQALRRAEGPPNAPVTWRVGAAYAGAGAFCLAAWAGIWALVA